MSVICKTDQGAVLDHFEYLQKVYAECRHARKASSDDSSTSYRFKADFFDLQHPFMMDSQFEKLKAAKTKAESPEAESSTKMQKVKKKKRKFDEMNEGIKDAAAFHEKIKSILEGALNQLLSLAQTLGAFTTMSPNLVDNNLTARRAGQEIIGPGDSLREMSAMAAEAGVCDEDAVNLDSSSKDQPTLFNTLIHNKDETAAVRSLLGEHYLIPPQCSFLMSDISCTEPLLIGDDKYDLIVIDPPWQNKSVKRKHKYAMLDNDLLLSLPVPRLTTGQCLVAVWATNKQQQQRFIREELFSRWNVTVTGQWFWLKVTKSGEPIVSLDSDHKKPYETLIIGRVSPKTEGGVPTLQTENDIQMIPDNFVIVSVPSSLHSHKPPLCDVLAPYLPSRPRCLELFARNLNPGWTSWGNEVLKLQHLDFFEKLP